MLKKERQALILHQLNLHNQVLSANLSLDLKVSEDTIRRDLQELADKGKLIKVHGGALSLSYNDFHYGSTHVYALQQKKEIARKAAKLIKDDMYVLTTGGTTLIELARALPPTLRATFISGSIPVALEYTYHPNIEVIMIGDKVSRNSKLTVGGDAIEKIRQIKADLCILGVNALDPEAGLTDNDWSVVQIKKAMIGASKKTVCLTIAEKLNSCQPLQICDLGGIDVLVTELHQGTPVLEPYRQKGVEVI